MAVHSCQCPEQLGWQVRGALTLQCNACNTAPSPWKLPSWVQVWRTWVEAKPEWNWSLQTAMPRKSNQSALKNTLKTGYKIRHRKMHSGELNIFPSNPARHVLMCVAISLIIQEHQMAHSLNKSYLVQTTKKAMRSIKQSCIIVIHRSLSCQKKQFCSLICYHLSFWLVSLGLKQ